ncbi:unnamed protein product [Lactuca virosa]|uniref:F-box/LRR-repeat protein 15/At3g58940/PEG3-like LRR domain-containing protein n=1 Tax=Lactuca virosa TaxID=75947 RepID=A0AAU9NUJ8_9ASTR|nr:unnamed protein product [Lactuca virosa]
MNQLARRESISEMRSNTQLEDVPELMQRIQLLLPVNEAARTSVLSKSWLHALSTIPNLRFYVRETNHLKLVDRTLNWYSHFNMPIESFDLNIRIENQESASLAENWIRFVATKTCLKELSLTFYLYGASLTLPDEILSVAKNLTILRVVTTRGCHSLWMKSSHHPPTINCVYLREVLFRGVGISQEVFDGILSSCRLLEKLELTLCSQRELKTIKVINFHRLYELIIHLEHANSTAVEISHVPNLRLFSCLLGGPNDTHLSNVCSLSLGRSVTELSLGGLIKDDASLDMIKSGFPFLESLTLYMGCWTLGSFHFTCASLKRLSLLWCPLHNFTDVQVYAPKLIFFSFIGYSMPSLLFPISTLHKTTFSMILYKPLDASFFLKMREALALSSECKINISKDYEPPSDIDIDDLRTRLPFPPANNVRRLVFETNKDECLWEHSQFFDAFFEICHPKKVVAKPDVHFRHTNHFCKLMLREVLEKKTTRGGQYWCRYLKDAQIRPHETWETLTNSHRSFLDGPESATYFKLNWSTNVNE